MQTLLLIPTSKHTQAQDALKTLIEEAGKRVALLEPFAGDSKGQCGCKSGISLVKQAAAAGNTDELMERIFAQASQTDADVLLVTGLSSSGCRPFAQDVNLELASTLDARVILLADKDDPARIQAYAQKFGTRVAGVVFTNLDIQIDHLDTLSHIHAGKAQGTQALTSLLEDTTTPRLSPAAFRHALIQKAKAANKRIVLPEGDEPRTVEAAIICQEKGIANCVLLAKQEAVNAVVDAKGLTLPQGLEIIDPDTIKGDYIDAMVERRKGKLDADGAKKALEDTVVLGTMMLQMDDVDGLVSGAVHTTADTIRPAFQLIKTAPEYSLVSSVFFMLLPDEVAVYGDCAVNPNPSAEQIAEIALQSAESARAFGLDPRVALISYSTGKSGMGPDVEKVSAAFDALVARDASLKVDGPLQFDAATVPSVGRQKAPDSKVAGRANVLIFPDLNTGNTTYKAVQRSAGVISVGPMLQGLNKPVNDLSRGALVDDIVFTIALTAIQAVK